MVLCLDQALKRMLPLTFAFHCGHADHSSCSADVRHRQRQETSSSASPLRRAHRDGSLEGGRAGGNELIQPTRSARPLLGGGGKKSEPRRGLGASCMRYSPSGSHLAIGCRNGCLVIMAAVDSTGEEHDVKDLATEAGKPSEKRHVEKSDRKGPDRDGVDDDRDEVALGSGEPQRSEGVGRKDAALKALREDSCYTGPRLMRYRRVACLKGHSSRVLHLDWTTDGRFVHTCGQDYQVLHWEILPPGGNLSNSISSHDGSGDFRPRIFQRPFLLRDARWATWSSTLGWPVQVKKRGCVVQAPALLCPLLLAVWCQSERHGNSLLFEVTCIFVSFRC